MRRSSRVRVVVNVNAVVGDGIPGDAVEEGKHRNVASGGRCVGESFSTGMRSSIKPAALMKSLDLTCCA